ncbi:protein tyrosine phosphatase domain-containing protein 1-like [Watersipora subatra]|uniref:protein tyrosine phosphatase domain-containing protein 1-like n=1 Tax=Watersipora subatra TaxID=2589382 RepID=UPI00355B312F
MWEDDWDADTDKTKVSESIEWGEHIDKQKTDVNHNPTGAYNKISEALRQTFPHEATCSMFCGGKKCKYCCDETWKKDEQAIKGLYSHWVTSNILATSRPITYLVEKHDVIRQFNENGLNAIINVQLPGEHAACGEGLHEGEFSYRQQQFMDGGIFFYNFGWKDFGVVESMSALLDMVKVMQFAISEGKVAIHCHAGKGRTGVLIACFLVFHNRMSANEAVHYVRSRRPGSVQTGPQVKCVQDFEKFLKPFRVIFSDHTESSLSNLSQHLMRQRSMLHGFEARKLKHLPKIIYILCERMLKLAKKRELLHIPSEQSRDVELETSPLVLQPARHSREADAISNGDSVFDLTAVEHKRRSPGSGVHGQGQMVEEVCEVAQALAMDQPSAEVMEKVKNYERLLNDEDEAWEKLKVETNPVILTTLLWDWFEQLKDPVIRAQDRDLLLKYREEPHLAINQMDKGVKATLTYLMRLLVRLQPIQEELECDILQKLIGVLTHRSFELKIVSASCDDLRASTISFTEKKNADRLGVFRFFYNLLENMEDEESAKKATKSSP